jgi:MFS family permease
MATAHWRIGFDKLICHIRHPYPTDNTTSSQRHGMHTLWWNSVWSSVSGAFYGDFVTLYMLALGASAASVGTRSAINSAAALAAPFVGAWLVARSGHRKKWVLLWPGGISRLVLLLLALLPLAFQGELAVNIMVALIALQAFSDTLASPAGSSLFADIVPARIRGRYLGILMTMSNIVRLAIVPMVGWLIRRIGGLAGYQVAWGLAALIGMGATITYARLAEPRNQEHEQGSAWRNFLDGWVLVFHDRRFVLFCVINFVWNLGVGFAGPFFPVYMVKDLGFQVDTVALLVTITTAVTTVSYWLAGFWVDRQGSLKVTAISMLFVPLLPLLWIPARTPLQVGLAQSYGNIAWAGFQVAATPVILLLTPPEHRARYIAIYNTINGLSSIIAPITASWIYARWGFTMNLVLSAGGRAAGAIFFWLFWRKGGLDTRPTSPRTVAGSAV